MRLIGGHIPDRSPGHAFVPRLAAALPPPTPLDSRLRGNDELRGRNGEIAEWRGSTARSKAA